MTKSSLIKMLEKTNSSDIPLPFKLTKILVTQLELPKIFINHVGILIPIDDEKFAITTLSSIRPWELRENSLFPKGPRLIYTPILPLRNPTGIHTNYEVINISSLDNTEISLELININKIPIEPYWLSQLTSEKWELTHWNVRKFTFLELEVKAEQKAKYINGILNEQLDYDEYL